MPLWLVRVLVAVNSAKQSLYCITYFKHFVFCVIRSGAMVRKIVISWVGFRKHISPSGISVQTYHLQTMSTCNRVGMCTMEHCNILTSKTPHDRSDFDILAIATINYMHHIP